MARGNRKWDLDPKRYPFAWMKKPNPGGSGRPKGSVSSQYGKAEITSLKIPRGIKKILYAIAEERNISISRLAAEFFEASILRAGAPWKQALIYEKRAKRLPPAVLEQFDWSMLDTPLLEETCIEDREDPDALMSETIDMPDEPSDDF